MQNKYDQDTCSFCGKRYISYESPMLKDAVWESISNEDFDENGKWVAQHMCLECMEERLGRKVNETDLMLTESRGRPCHVWWNEKFVKRYGKKRVFPLWGEINADLLQTYMENFNGGKNK